jgi:hypothetical protein
MNNDQTAALLLIEMQKAKFKTNHILHLLLTLVTCGLWGIVWMIVAASNATERSKLKRAENKLLGIVPVEGENA